MRKRILAYAGVIAISACQLAPARADGMAGSVGMFPVQALSLVAGCAAGIPIAAARLSAKNFKDLSHEFSGDIMSYKFWGGLSALVVAIPKGTLQGCYYGPRNAISNCVDKPFSRDAFSLGELP